MNWWQILLTCWGSGVILGWVTTYFRLKNNSETRRQFCVECATCVVAWAFALYIAYDEWDWLNERLGSTKSEEGASL